MKKNTFTKQSFMKKFNYGIHNGRVANMGNYIGRIIQDTIMLFIPGTPGKIVGGLVALPVLAPTELVSGFHAGLSNRHVEWFYAPDDRR